MDKKMRGNAIAWLVLIDIILVGISAHTENVIGMAVGFLCGVVAGPIGTTIGAALGIIVESIIKLYIK